MISCMLQFSDDENGACLIHQQEASYECVGYPPLFISIDSNHEASTFLLAMGSGKWEAPSFLGGVLPTTGVLTVSSLESRECVVKK